jgi:hypothetical protein
MNQTINLNDGGYCVVMAGKHGRVVEFTNNPKVLIVDCHEVAKDALNAVIPVDGLKAVIITEGIPQWHYMWITSLCNTKKIPYLIRKSNQAVYETLKSFFPTPEVKPTNEQVQEAISRGKLTVLLQDIDWSLSNAENAKKLLRIAQLKNIPTTFGSLAQWVSNQRRKQSGTAIVKSARPKLDLTVDMLDETIKNLEDMRDFLIATVEENRIIKAKYDKLKKALEDI